MARVVEHRLGRAAFDDAAEIHHHHTVAQQPDHVQVVADEQIAHAERGLELREQLEDGDLHRDVERCGRLVEHQQRGPRADGARDPDARALAARQLMGKPPEQLERQTAQGGRLLDLLAQRRAAQAEQPAQRVGDRVRRGEARVDALAGVLEHDLDARAVGVAREPPGLEERQLAAAEADRAVARVEQARLADQPDRLAARDREADVVDRPYLRRLGAPEPRPPADREAPRQLGEIEQDRALGGRGRRHAGFQQATTCAGASSRHAIGSSHATTRRVQRAA